MEVDEMHGIATVVEDAIDFSFHQADSEEIVFLKGGDQPGSEEAALLEQFRRLFAPILDDSLKLYYQLNDSDDAEHVRIHQTVAHLNEVNSSEEETMVTQVNSPHHRRWRWRSPCCPFRATVRRRAVPSTRFTPRRRLIPVACC